MGKITDIVDESIESDDGKEYPPGTDWFVAFSIAAAVIFVPIFIVTKSLVFFFAPFLVGGLAYLYARHSANSNSYSRSVSVRRNDDEN